MTALAEHDTGTAARILAAARELVLKRGVKGLDNRRDRRGGTRRQGTAYLYWKASRTSCSGCSLGDFLATVDDEIDTLITDPEIARP